MIKRFAIISFVTLVTSAVPYNDFDDLSHLGERITAQVENDLAPLHNLGARINAAVQENLKPVRSMNYRRQFVQPQFEDLGSQIAASVQAGLAPLNNLGQQIQQSVQQGLLPVKAMQLTMNMKLGVGGITVVTHSPSGKQFVFKEGKAYHCVGTIGYSGKCDGTLEPYTIKNNTDFCFIRNSFSTINDYICVGATSVQIINNNVRCHNMDNSPVLVMKRDEYVNMCKNLSQQAEYKYFADPNNPNHIKIPNDNKYVQCSNNEPNVCIFTESTAINGLNFIQTGNTFYSNTYSNSYINTK